MEYKEIQCYIEDVQFRDYWNDVQGIPYNNIIIIVLRNAETDEVYSGAWSEADVRKLAEIPDKLSSRQMIDFATLLRQRSELILITVPDNDEKIIITPELLMQSDETNRQKKENIDKFQGNEHLGEKERKVITIGFKQFREGAQIPTKETTHAIGWDLYAWIEGGGCITLRPHKTQVIKTGLNVELPLGYEMSIRPRSGAAARRSLTVLNSPGLIDPDYSGNFDKFEICVILHNDGEDEQIIAHGDRIAQATFHEVPEVEVIKLDRDVIPHASNRVGGLGHTGNK